MRNFKLTRILKIENSKRFNGKDKGKTFLVVKTENEHSYIANGRRRKAEKPKKKKNKHLEIIGKTDCSVLTNKEIKKKINEFLKKKEGER